VIEYRTGSGQRIELAAGGQLYSTRHEVNLRTLGCPDWLATRVENARRKREAAARGTEPEAPPVLTLSEMKERAAKLGDQIAADAKRFGEDEESRQRMRQQASAFLRG
jgi:hypothetical protein